MATQSPTGESHPRFTEISGWLCRPLCCRYAFAEFKVLCLPIRNDGAVEHVPWLWAFGLFKQDQYEILGAWSGQPDLAQVAYDLHERGIEHIEAIAAEGDAGFAPHAAPWPLADGGLDALPPSIAGTFGHRRRTALQSATATAERLHKSITRAIRRRAPFASEVAAATFLAQALERADRQLYAT